MDRPEWNDDRIAFESSIQIRWLRDVYLRAIRLLPKVCFGDPEFADFAEVPGRVSVEAVEFCAFYQKLGAAFKDNSAAREVLVDSVAKGLRHYEKVVGEAERAWDSGQQFSPDEVKRHMEEMSAVVAFGVFNECIPVSWFDRLIGDLSAISGTDSALDDFLVSMVQPHRIWVRRGKLGVSLEYSTNGDVSPRSLAEYRDKYGAYELFEEWCFGDVRLKDQRFLMKEVKSTCNSLSTAEIAEEIDRLDENTRSIQRKMMCALAALGSAADSLDEGVSTKDVLDSLSLLSLITTQEEVRHMLQARHLVILGRLVKQAGISPAFSSIEDVVMACKGIRRLPEATGVSAQFAIGG